MGGDHVLLLAIGAKIRCEIVEIFLQPKGGNDCNVTTNTAEVSTVIFTVGGTGGTAWDNSFS